MSENYEKVFDNFEAKYQEIPDGFILDWYNKNGSATNSFSLIRRNSTLFISGGLGSAVIDGFNKPYPLEWYGKLEPEYLLNKAACSSYTYYYDAEEMEVELVKFIREMRPSNWPNYSMTDSEYESRIESAVENVMDTFDEDRGIDIDTLFKEVWAIYDESDYPSVCEFSENHTARHLCQPVKYWPVAIRMAEKQLKERGILPDEKLRDLSYDDVLELAKAGLSSVGDMFKHNGQMFRIKSFVGRRSIVYAYRCKDNEIVKFERPPMARKHKGE